MDSFFPAGTDTFLSQCSIYTCTDVLSILQIIQSILVSLLSGAIHAVPMTLKGAVWIDLSIPIIYVQ